MKFRLRTYTAYSIGCGIAWSIVWSIIGTIRPEAAPRRLLLFAGWVLGWLSATIARSVDPPHADPAGPARDLMT